MDPYTAHKTYIHSTYTPIQITLQFYEKINENANIWLIRQFQNN